MPLHAIMHGLLYVERQKNKLWTTVGRIIPEASLGTSKCGGMKVDALTARCRLFLRGRHLCSYSRTPIILRNPTVHYCVHKGPIPTGPYLEPVQSSPYTPSYLSKLNPHITYNVGKRPLRKPLHHGFLSGLFPSGFPINNLFAFLFSNIRATCHAHLILIYLIILIMLGEEYKSRSSSLCSFLHLPITSSFFGPNILFCNLFSDTLGYWSSLRVRNQVLHPTEPQAKL
jgi:hypothetical protein